MAIQLTDRPDAGQEWSARDYARYGRFVADLARDLVAELDPAPGERVLDLGCGDGELSLSIAGRGSEVVGLDASEDMVTSARARGVNAQIGDGHLLRFHREFDAVFSNAALHWMRRDPDAVIDGVSRALRPGGRFVAEMGSAGNVASLRNALYSALALRGIRAAPFDPWYFPSLEEYRARLEHAGFLVVSIRSFERPTPLPADAAQWLKTFAKSFLYAVPEADRAALVHEVQERLRSRMQNPDGLWTGDYVRLRFVAIKRSYL